MSIAEACLAFHRDLKAVIKKGQKIKRPAAPKHEEQIEEQIKQEGTSEQLVPPKLPPKREQQSKQKEKDQYVKTQSNGPFWQKSLDTRSLGDRRRPHPSDVGARSQ